MSIFERDYDANFLPLETFAVGDIIRYKYDRDYFWDGSITYRVTDVQDKGKRAYIKPLGYDNVYRDGPGWTSFPENWMKI